MDKAIAESLGKKYEKYVSSGEDSDWDNDGPKKLKEFSGKGNYISEEVFVNYEKFQYSEEDIEMLHFMKESLVEQYATEPKSGMKVLFRYSNGKKEQRIFPEGSII